ncbi:hypothetical protein L1887_57651 [Cichorium endivia]|nr:hypothetical protein L1887_57651 [Cichorium endivia]
MRAADTARRKAESRAEETPVEYEGRLRQDASRHKARRAAEETDVAQARLRQAALRKANARAAEAPEESAARRRGDADRHTTARAAESPQETASRLLLQASRQADARAAETMTQTSARRRGDADRHTTARAAEAPDVAETRRRDQTARKRAARLAESFEARNVRLHTDNVRHLRSRAVDSNAPQPAPRDRARADPVEPQGPCELFEDAMKRLHCETLFLPDTDTLISQSADHTWILKDLTSVVAVRMRDSSGHVDFRVRSGVVRAALVWLRENNPHYANIDLNEDNLALLPEDGDAFSEVQGYDYEEPDDPPAFNASPPPESATTGSQEVASRQDDAEVQRI